MRPRLGLAGESGGALAIGPPISLTFVGIRGVAGAQIDDQQAVYARIAVASSFYFGNEARFALIYEYTPRDRYSFGLGLGPDGFLTPCVTQGGPLTNCMGAGIVAPLLFSMHTGDRDENGARKVFSFTFELRPGVDLLPDTSLHRGRFYLGSSFSLGFDRM